MTDIIRAWKDEEYRLSLSEAERTLLPDNPAGLMELSDADLASIAGGSANISGDGNVTCGIAVTCGDADTCGVAITCGAGCHVHIKVKIKK